MYSTVKVTVTMTDQGKFLVPAAAAALAATVTWAVMRPAKAKNEKMELFYFNIEGKAESIRLAAYHGGVALTDTRLTGEQFAEMQGNGKLVYGQVPALRVGTGPSARTLGQSAAILKFVGKKAGLYPVDDDLLAAKIDGLMDEEADLFCGLTVSRYPWRFGFDAAGCKVGCLGPYKMVRRQFHLLFVDPCSLLQGAQDRQCTVTAAVREKLMDEVLPKHLAHLEVG